MYGIIFGYIPTASDGGKDPMEYFIINNQHKMYIGNRTWYTYYVELTKLYIGNASQNTLKVVKIGQLLYYFINNIYSYCSEMETKDNGNKFGFMVPPKGVVYIDNLFISVKSSSKMPSIEKNASKTIDFRVVAAEPINQLKKQN
jgi:hypothetical protein